METHFKLLLSIKSLRSNVCSSVHVKYSSIKLGLYKFHLLDLKKDIFIFINKIASFVVSDPCETTKEVSWIKLIFVESMREKMLTLLFLLWYKERNCMLRNFVIKFLVKYTVQSPAAFSRNVCALQIVIIDHHCTVASEAIERGGG